MNEYFIDLNIDINPVKSEHTRFTDPFSFSDSKNFGHVIFYPVNKFINSELINFYHSLGIETRFAECFFSPADSFSVIHRDAPRRPCDITKINWCYGGRGSTMNWYKDLRDPTMPREISRREHSGYFHEFLQYDIDELELACQHTIAQPTMVKVGVPHNITNPQEPRSVISTFLHWPNGDYVKFDQARELFSSYIKK